jgi:hypothetical protein
LRLAGHLTVIRANVAGATLRAKRRASRGALDAILRAPSKCPLAQDVLAE